LDATRPRRKCNCVVLGLMLVESKRWGIVKGLTHDPVFVAYLGSGVDGVQVLGVCAAGVGEFD
jgi:hypothetical protein